MKPYILYYMIVDPATKTNYACLRYNDKHIADVIRYFQKTQKCDDLEVWEVAESEINKRPLRGYICATGNIL